MIKTPLPSQPAGDSVAVKKLSAAEKTLLVLESIADRPRYSDIVTSTGLAKATVHRILAVLSARGFVRISEDGAYLPGPRIWSLAGQAWQPGRVVDIAEPYIETLVDQLNCTVHLGSLSGDRAVYVSKVEPNDKPYQMPSRIGHDIPLHSSGIGKCILAQWTPERLEQYIAQPGLEQRTVRTITNPATLRKELELVRQRGYALDQEENVPGIICVAAPVYDHLGRVVHAISASTITLEHTIAEVEAMAPAVMACAEQISQQMGYLPPSLTDQMKE